MEVKEAIWRLKEHFRVHDDGRRPTPKLDEACKIAYECMEKQLSKKVVDRSLVKDNGIVVGFIGRCPNCNEIIGSTTTVCDCGQKIDWSEAH